MGQYHHTEAGNTFNRQFCLADPDSGFRTQQAHPGFAAVAPLAGLCAWFLLLQAMPNDMMIATDLPTLMALNTSQLRLDPRHGSSDSTELWEAMAARFSSSLSKPDDEPGVPWQGRWRAYAKILPLFSPAFIIVARYCTPPAS